MSNKIKNKTSDPFIQEFATTDLLINVVDGKLFYRSRDKLFEVFANEVTTATADFGGETTQLPSDDLLAFNITASGLITASLGDYVSLVVDRFTASHQAIFGRNTGTTASIDGGDSHILINHNSIIAKSEVSSGDLFISNEGKEPTTIDQTGTLSDDIIFSTGDRYSFRCRSGITPDGGGIGDFIISDREFIRIKGKESRFQITTDVTTLPGVASGVDTYVELHGEGGHITASGNLNVAGTCIFSGDITSSGRFDSTNDNFIFNGGNQNQVIFVQSNDSDVFIDFEDDSTTDNVLIGAKGDDIYLRTDAGGGGIHTQGLNNASTGNTVFFNTGTYELTYSSSTRKIKKNIINIPTEGLLESFNKIKPRKFTYKNNNEEEYGFIAEEISEVNPLLAVWGKDFAYDEKGKKIQLPRKTNDKLEEPTYKLDSSNKVPIDINDRSLLAVAIAKIQELEQRIKKIENERSL